MADSAQFANRVKALIAPGPRGIVSVVDDLVLLSRNFAMSLNIRDNRCWIRRTDAYFGEAIELPWRRCIRAMLARIAVLCNERIHDSVSPYGGTGELTVPGNPPTVALVAFSNMFGEYYLDICPVPTEWISTASDAALTVGEMHTPGTDAN